MLYYSRFFFLLLFILIAFVVIYYENNNNAMFISSELLQNNSKIIGKAKIIDGDSIMLNKNEIRLQDIDAPEYDQECHDVNNKKYKCGNSAKFFLKKIINNQELSCNISGRDFYNRLLGTCFLNSKNINQEMVKNGHAIRYSANPLYYADELYAKHNKLGVWQGDFITPKQYRKSKY
jgi:endonuclease YncB( thermonuclease family)